MKIANSIVDNLGLKMYDKVSAVVAELIANAYDADAEKVTIKLPLGKALAIKKNDGSIDDKDYLIEIIDDGHGMTQKQANEFYLTVGLDRRNTPGLGSKSRIKKRKVMGRKGIGKLAPFGICKTIQIRSAGGQQTAEGYKVIHFELDYFGIVSIKNEEGKYYPSPLADDGTFDKIRGTKITLKNFNPHTVPDKETFERQLAARFGIEMPDFKIVVEDNKKENPVNPFQISEANIPLMEDTRIIVDDKPVIVGNEKFKVTGWVGMAKESYKNEELAGIRIYCHNKIAAVTRDFGLPSGFQGEFTIRSYLVGAIHADWLDEEEDLIQTHRHDILWSSELGSSFSKWGQGLIKEVAKRGRKPHRNKSKLKFLEVSKLKERVEQRYKDRELREATIKLGEKIGEIVSDEDLRDADYMNDISDFILSVGPHKMFIDALKEIAAMSEKGVIKIIDLLKLFETTKIAQLASYGQIVEEKLNTIDVFAEAIYDPDTKESELQNIIEDAPWLVNPQWTLILSNRTLKTFQESFEKWYENIYGQKIITSCDESTENKRPDFIFLNQDNSLFLLEIKPPKHIFNNDDWNRLLNYHEAIKHFFETSPDFNSSFPRGYKIILITNDFDLGKNESMAMNSLFLERILIKLSWSEILKTTKDFHKDFLDHRDTH